MAPPACDPEIAPRVAEFGVSLLSAALRGTVVQDDASGGDGGDAVVEGLAEWLLGCDLGEHISQATAWCHENGAVELDEVMENLADFGEALALKPMELQRLQDGAKKHLAVEHKPSSDVAEPGVHIAGGSDTKERAAAEEEVERPQEELYRFSSYPGTGEQEEARQYTLKEQLGSGATAKVYRCVNGLGQEFAVKTVVFDARKRLSGGFEDVSEMLYQEVTILLSMQHPRIVSLFDVVEEPGSLRLVMELIKGGDLADKLLKQESGRLEESEAKAFFVQIAEGLQYIHSKGIVHRDLKPDNILVDELDQVRISDFGHSRLVDGVGSANERVGTILYMSPEALDPQRAVEGFEHATDLWSFGVILYLMLVGNTPFGGMNLEEEIQQASYTFATLTPNSYVPSMAAQDLVKALIVVEPTERLAIQWCLTHQWITSAEDRLRQILRLSTEGEPEALEDRYELPGSLLSKPHQLLRRDLQHWTVKFRFSAMVTKSEVIVNYGESEKVKHQDVDLARRELLAVMRHHFGVVLQRSRKGQDQSAAKESKPTVGWLARQLTLRKAAKVAAKQDVERIRAIIQECKDAGMQGSDLDNANSLLQRKELRVQARTELQNATAARLRELLQFAIKLGEAAGLDECELAEAREVLREEDAKAAAWDGLKVAMSSVGLDGLEAAISTCLAAGLPSGDLSGAQRLLNQSKVVGVRVPAGFDAVKAQAELESASQRRDVVALASAIRVARGCLVAQPLIDAAEEKLKELPSESAARQQRLEARKVGKAATKWNFTGQATTRPRRKL